MKTHLHKKCFILVLVLLTAITFFSLKSEGQAAEQWITATLTLAGPGWGSTYICVSAVNGSFYNKFMLARIGQEKDQLATALTAISLGKSAWVYADPSLATPTIQALYIIN